MHGEAVLQSFLVEYHKHYPPDKQSWKHEWQNIYQQSLLVLWPMVLIARNQQDRADHAWSVSNRVMQRCKSDNMFCSLLCDYRDDKLDWDRWGELMWMDTVGCMPEVSLGTDPKTLLRMAEQLIRRWDATPLAEVASTISNKYDANGEPMSLEVILFAVAMVTLLASAPLLTLQLVKPSAEFLAVRDLALKHAWAPKLLRSGPFLAERTNWSVAKAWKEELFEHEELGEACQVLGNCANYATIQPEVGDKFDKAQMLRSDEVQQKWVLAVESVGLAHASKTIQKATIQCATADCVALSKTSSERLSGKYIGAIPDASTLRDHHFNSDSMGAVRDACRDDDELHAWLKLITAKCPSNDLDLISSKPGAKLDEREMSTTRPVHIPATAVVKRLVCPGLRRGKQVLIHAHVEAADQ